MYALLNNEFAPLSWSPGFLETDIESIVEAYIEWGTGIFSPSRKVSYVRQSIHTSLRDCLISLYPLTFPEPVRTIFVPTTGKWVLCLNSGGSPSSIIAYLHHKQRLDCRGIYVLAQPDTWRLEAGQKDKITNRDLMLQYYSPDVSASYLNPAGIARSISVGVEGCWQFNEAGKPLPFEDTEQYKQRRKKDRFTFEMLANYLENFGIRAFDESFYLPVGTSAIVVERIALLNDNTGVVSYTDLHKYRDQCIYKY